MILMRRFSPAPMIAAAAFARLLRDRKAVTALEYALICAVTTMAILTGLALFDSNAIIPEGKISGALGGGPSASSPVSSPAASPVAPAISPACNAAACTGAPAQPDVSMPSTMAK